MFVVIIDEDSHAVQENGNTEENENVEKKFKQYLKTAYYDAKYFSSNYDINTIDYFYNAGKEDFVRKMYKELFKENINEKED